MASAWLQHISVSVYRPAYRHIIISASLSASFTLAFARWRRTRSFVRSSDLRTAVEACGRNVFALPQANPRISPRHEVRTAIFAYAHFQMLRNSHAVSHAYFHRELHISVASTHNIARWFILIFCSHRLRFRKRKQSLNTLQRNVIYSPARPARSARSSHFSILS